MKLMLEVPPCTDLTEACQEAQRIADTVGMQVEFQFNSVCCVAQPGGDSDELAERQQRKSSEVPTVYSAGTPF